MTIRVFISHAGKDRERFVNSLVARLKNDEIPVWFSEDEIEIGDNLVEKISEGIASCNRIIIVLSENTVHNNWVKYEQQMGLYKQITKLENIYPIIIDQIQIPNALQTTVYCAIPNVNEYDDEYAGILRAIKKTQPSVNIRQMLDPLDRQVLVWSGEQAQKDENFHSLTKLQNVFVHISVDELNGAVRYLEELGLVSCVTAMGDLKFAVYSLTPRGIVEFYSSLGVPGYQAEARVGRSVVTGFTHASKISAETGMSTTVIKLFLEYLKADGLLSLTHTFSDTIVGSVSERLKRMYSKHS